MESANEREILIAIAEGDFFVVYKEEVSGLKKSAIIQEYK